MVVAAACDNEVFSVSDGLVPAAGEWGVAVYGDFLPVPREKVKLVDIGGGAGDREPAEDSDLWPDQGH